MNRSYCTAIYDFNTVLVIVKENSITFTMQLGSYGFLDVERSP